MKNMQPPLETKETKMNAMRHQFLPIRSTKIKKADNNQWWPQALSCTVGRNINWFYHFMERSLTACVKSL